MIDKELFRFKKINAICLDTETESLSLSGSSRPWDISWIVIEDGVKTAEFQCFPLIKNLKVSRDAARVTRFDFLEWKKKATDPVKVYEKLSKYLYDPKYLIIGMNILKFDVYQIASFQKYLGIKPDFSYVPRIYDVLSLARGFKSNDKFPEKKEEILPWMYTWSSYCPRGMKANLRQLCKDFKIEYFSERHHEGAYDIELTFNVFKKICEVYNVW